MPVEVLPWGTSVSSVIPISQQLLWIYVDISQQALVLPTVRVEPENTDVQTSVRMV